MSLPQISAAEEIMRLAITGQQHLDALIGYYRSEIDRYNDQRAQWALKYQDLKDNASNKYILQQELDQSRHKVNKFETDLNIIKANLNKQRQKYFQMIEKNQEFKNKLEDNKKRYREMVAICKPISVGDKKEAKKSRNQNQRNNSRLNDSQGLRSAKGEIQLELINVGKQHDQKKAHLQKYIDSLKEDLDELISQHNERDQHSSKEYKKALQALSETESKIMLLTSEYFKLRMNSYEQQRRVQQQNQILRLKAVAVARKLQILSQAHSEQFKTVDKEVKQCNKAFKQKYDEQLKKKQEHLSILKEQNDKINNIYLMKLKKLQSQLREVTDRQRTIDEKSKTQVSSLKSQIKILKSRLQRDGVKQMREQLADRDDEDESSQSLSVEQLQRINREVDQLKKKI